MDCYPPCKVCTDLCNRETPKPTRRVTPSPRKPPEKRGTTLLTCGHVVPLSTITHHTLGRLGSTEYLCDRCGDWFKARQVRARKTKDPGDGQLELPPF
jgi:hypothetical protein